MKNAYFILYSDGQMAVQMLNANKYGYPTPKTKQHLIKEGYTSFANLTQITLSAQVGVNHGELKAIAQALGLLHKD